MAAKHAASTALLIDDRFLGHDTGQHPEHPRRIAAIQLALREAELLNDRTRVEIRPATDEQILRVHTATHLARLEQAVQAGGAWIDADTLVGPDSLNVARLAAGAAVAAVDAVVHGSIQRAFCIGRPPGHHATPDRAMGFCLLNSVAIAASHARSLGLQRVAIIDWDVHHGNGTQDIFYRDPDVWYASLHQSPLYPGTGGRAETGVDAGLGTTLNCPLLPMSGNEKWLETMRDTVVPFIEEAAPELILLSAGYDAHRHDPIGSCQVDDDGFAELTRVVADMADRHTGGKVIAVLEGGYDPDTLGRSVARSLQALDGAN
jgi:acetoin utilization deacetylase AcuC-like enzyme